MVNKELLSKIKVDFGKKFKNRASGSLELNTAADTDPVTGLVVDNPLLEFLLDRMFIAYGRAYLLFGKKSCGKTSFLFELAKHFIAAKGVFFWIETERAADLDYMRRQGVNEDQCIFEQPNNLEEAVTLIRTIIRAKASITDDDTPIMIGLDSIAGNPTEYEQEQDVVGDTKPGEHAKTLSTFYRNIIPLLETCPMILVCTNHLKSKIGGTGYGDNKAMIGGEAPLFNSTYQLEFVRTGDMKAIDPLSGVERKIGSEHQITVTRNKLGREGTSQRITVYLRIDGGIDWPLSLLKTLTGDNWKKAGLLDRRGAKYYSPKPYKYKLKDGTEGVLSVEDGFSAVELMEYLWYAPEFKQDCRASFGIPKMVTPKEESKIKENSKAKRKKLVAELKEEADDGFKTEN